MNWTRFAVQPHSSTSRVGREMLAEANPKGSCAKFVQSLARCSSVHGFFADLGYREKLTHFPRHQSRSRCSARGKGISSDKGLRAGVHQPHAADRPRCAFRERFCSAIDESLGRHTTSLIAVPLMTEQAVLGVLEVLNKTTGRCFDDVDLDVLSARPA